ncbi:PadR family transcriptional regulator [Sandaracinobacteroides hominis]|uniref:PadR family transcriptional regulator n=1 Tax=Sandaracinobacteroides hominis TaxID=2780086 RepID=UPI0018F4148D|nr:PadR family transcriptional regulator [Sandaracinobacteroides hominis]
MRTYHHSGPDGREHGQHEHGGRGFGGHFAARFGGRGFGGGFGGFGPERGEEFGGRRRRRQFDGEALRLILLKLIAEEPRHGYELIRAIEELSGGAYAPSPGVVYPTLSLLAELGLIAETEAEGARKRFAATAEGTAQLEEHAEIVAALMERLSAMAGPSGRVDPAPLKRAMANLGNVLRTRMHEDGLDKAKLLDIAALIDEAASKIERL